MSSTFLEPSRNTASTTAADTAAREEAHRVRLGANAATPADVLLALAADPSVTVRAALALNPAAPADTLTALARDSDRRVRALLAHRLASLAPSLDEDGQSHLNQQAWAALTHLVEDEAVRVRAAIAEAIQDMPNAPRDLVLRLARDAAIEVSGPVIRLSPMLTQADLLTLLASADSPSIAIAMARRPCLTEQVADAIANVHATNPEAIQALLSNQSAQIREATLDALIAHAADHIDWHAPLVRRPDLSPRAARALSRIVADTLLAELAARADLDPVIAQELRARFDAHMATKPETAPSPDPTLSDALSQARAHRDAGTLSETELLTVVGRGEKRLAGAMLAVAADVPYLLVARAAALRSAKGLVSLAWKAGFGMRTAVALQGLLAQLAPGALLTAGPGGTFPLTIEEMRWQIEFLAHG